MMLVKAPNDLFFGCFLVGCGAAALHFVAGVPVGSAARMGAGFVPTWLGWTTIGLGMATIARGFIRGGEAPSRWAWRALAAVIAAIALFTLVERIGLVAAVAGASLAASLGDPQTRWGSAMALAALLSAFSSLVFVEFLGLPIPLLHRF